MLSAKFIRTALAASIFLLTSANFASAQSAADVAKVNAYLGQGGALIRQNKAKEAVEVFRAAKALAPNEAIVLCNLGFALERAGHYDEALTNLTESIRINPNIPIAWVNLGGLYQSIGDLPKSISTYEDYLKRFPNDKMVTDVRGILDIIKENNRLNTITKVTPDTPDYFSSVQRYGAEKWQPNRFPLKVFVDHGDVAHGYKEAYDEQMRSAFTEWQQKTNNVVSFVFVDAPQSADITVRWTDDIKRVSKVGEAGDCRTNLMGPEIRHADIMMLLVAPSDSIPLGPALIHWVGLHEVGHALGIAGHSVNPHDIMYSTMSYDYDQHGVTARDLATMRKIYQ